MHDLIVVGGGPVGVSLARAARGLSVALVANERRQPSVRAPFDPRVYALSPGNVAFLESLGVWQAIPAERRVPVYAMRIHGDDPAATLEFDAYGAGVPEVAWIVEDALLQDALWNGLEAEVFAPAQCQQLEVSGDRIELTLNNDKIRSKLVVGADGASSFVRTQANIAVSERDYEQRAVVANFRCSKPHGHRAWQWFRGGAVLAMLPLPGDHVSMVWSLPLAEAQRVSRLDAEALCREVSAAARGELGDLTLVTPPRSYALRRLAAEKLVAPRVALAGDAGHVIHPLAGQGLNLGLQDARVLAGVLAGREPHRDPGELRLLRRYERSRAEPILAMDTMVDALFRIFGSSSPLAARVRNAGLNLTDRLPVIKNMLMRHAMMGLFGVLIAASAFANEAQIRRTLEPKLGGAKIEGIRPAPISGLWEVHFRSARTGGMQVIYTDATAAYVIDGNIHELRTNRDLTGERLRKLNAIKFESLPLDLAVKIQRGNGKRVLAMFSDPYCPACRDFERTLGKLDDVTIYVFMYPVIRPQNADHSRAVWCSPDRAKAWLELAAAPKPKIPEAAPTCNNPVDKLIETGHRLGVNSTPTLFLANGERVSGGLSPDDLKELLDQPATARR